ncbi:peptidase M24, structural domain-containing protein [Phycomyces nitens]|nr:peptidase M24, structural domain-containing protein [Phycomyces nitens]
MTDMEVTPLYSQTKFASDNDLNDPKVLEMYLISADVVNTVLPLVVAKVSPGISVSDLCQFGDDLLLAHTEGMYKNSERGIALPTCVTINNLVQYYSPLPENDYNLKPNDLVKIELGAHVDGYIATAAHSTIVNTNPAQPITGRAADVICATYFAHEAAIRMLRPGVKSSEISRVISEIAAYYRCKPAEGTFSSLMKRFVLRAGKDIENQLNEEMTVKELENLDFEIEANQVYQLNIVLTTSDGKVKTAEDKPFLYQRDVNASYQLKMRSARLAFSEINANHTVFPFSTRALSGNQARLGLVSLLAHRLVTPYTVMRTQLSSDLVAQYKSTVLVLPEGPMQLTAAQPLPYVHSQYCIPQPTNAANVLSTPAVKQARKTKAKIAPVDVTFGERRADVQDVDME